jgi:hypothetical protein
VLSSLLYWLNYCHCEDTAETLGEAGKRQGASGKSKIKNQKSKIENPFDSGGGAAML